MVPKNIGIDTNIEPIICPISQSQKFDFLPSSGHEVVQKWLKMALLHIEKFGKVTWCFRRPNRPLVLYIFDVSVNFQILLN